MNLLDDLQTALRSLARRPGFAAVVALTLATALGANTAVFSVLQQTVLRPVPYPGAEDAVYIFRESPPGNVAVRPSVEHVRAWREGAESLARIEGFDTSRVTLREQGAPRRLRAARVTPGLFDFLGVSPEVGRGFGAGAGRETDGARRVVLSHALARELFGDVGSGDLGAALGEALRLGEEIYIVAGVMGRGFRFIPPVDVDVWLPVPEGPEADPSMVVLARLAPGVGREAAAEELLALERHRAERDPELDPEQLWTPRIQELGYLFGEDFGRTVTMLQAAVGLMLLIACANVGNLFLIRAEGRSREIAVRAALGAGRGRVVRTLMLESLILAGAGALLGLAFAGWGGGLIASLYGDRRVELEALRLDPGVFGFAGAAAVVAAFAFGLMPALTASRKDLGEVLEGGGRGTVGAGGSGCRTQAVMVVAEVALALVLLVGAGLLTKSFVGLVTTDPGFEPEGVVAATLELPEERYGEEELQRTFLRELRSAVGGSGFERAALAGGAPTQGAFFVGRNLRVEGRPPLPEGLVSLVSFVGADPGYFRTLELRFLEGRPFTEEDLRAGRGGEIPIVVNRTFARVLWPEGDALGGRLKLGFSEDEPWRRVVGVVENTAQMGLSSVHDLFQMYAPLERGRRVSVLVRAEGATPEAVGARLAPLVQEIDPWLPVARVEPVAELLGGSIAEQRFEMVLMLVFAGIALVLTVLGVYAVLAYAVRLRSFEIGVRSALGARPDQVLGLIARRGALLVGIGLALGMVAALALGRLVESQLHGVPARDPVVFATAIGVLALAAAVATLVPARRAARLDPARVLRAE
jgi:predicted permease